ncbi:ABC transporter substrate-binding protein [Bradyrhizobium sp. dw_411]|uniref:ABC transporter substrate-binding protein n=1 Tax=Bradyrhizobium sp. dw_411 TaxID=2720082 RepID=UPI001BCE790C|nr:ABC transporter substrate-binding protein [Bradyrhizobium sp. dw_411]
MAAGVRSPAIAQGAPVRVGQLTIKSGPLAQGGLLIEQGLATFLKDSGSTIGGRKVEIVVADTGGSPAGARSKVQELVEREKVDLIIGPITATEMLAISDYIRRAQIPIINLGGAEDLTQRHANPWMIRNVCSSGQASHAMGDFARKELGHNRVATISDDFAFGHEQVAGFQRVFEDEGGKVVRKLWPPLITPDYTPYIAQIQNVDATFMGFTGSNPVKFMRAYAELGVKKTIPLVGGWTTGDDALLKSLGDEAVGLHSASIYAATLQTDSNKRFVAAMLKDYDNVPGEYAAWAYVTGLCLDAALRTTGGDVSDKKKLMEALRGIALRDTPCGTFHFDKYGNIVGDIFIKRIDRKDGKLSNTIVKTYPEVSQFWTYPEEAFLAQPVYSRDFPPAKNLEN